MTASTSHLALMPNYLCECACYVYNYGPPEGFRAKVNKFNAPLIHLLILGATCVHVYIYVYYLCVITFSTYFLNPRTTKGVAKLPPP